MNEEKKTSQVKSSAGEYTAPKVKVKALRHRSVICASFTGNGINNMSEDENTDI